MYFAWLPSKTLYYNGKNLTSGGVIGFFESDSYPIRMNYSYVKHGAGHTLPVTLSYPLPTAWILVGYTPP